MALRGKLNGKSSDNPKKKKISKKTTKKQPTLNDSKLLEQIEDLLRSEPLPSNLKHTENVDQLCVAIQSYLSEWLKCYAIVGYTDDGKYIEIGCADTPMDEQALDGAIHNLYAARATLNGIEIKQRVQKYFIDDNEQY